MHGAINKSFPILQLPEIRRTPDHADLIKLLKLIETTKDKYIVQPWISGENQAFSLRVFLPGSGDEYQRLKDEGKLVHPEWTLLAGDTDDAAEVWVYSTRDIDLLWGLIMSEVEGKARASVMPMITATLHDLPTLQNRLQDTPCATQSQADEATHADPPSAPETSSHNVSKTHAQNAANALILSGTINGDELQNVVQSISSAKLTGALIVNSELEQAFVYFSDGDIVDATIEKALTSEHSPGQLRGDHAVLEVLIWTQGSFRFDYKRQPSRSTIEKKVAALVTAAVVLRDYCDDLTKRGLTKDSTLVQTRPADSQQQVLGV